MIPNMYAYSYENGCEYCMAAHSFLADVQSKVPAEVTEALRKGTDVPDVRLRALSRFTRILVQKRGRPRQADLDLFRIAGYTDAHVLQIALAIGVKTLSNYTNHLCGTPVDSAFLKTNLDAISRGLAVCGFLAAKKWSSSVYLFAILHRRTSVGVPLKGGRFHGNKVRERLEIYFRPYRWEFGPSPPEGAQSAFSSVRSLHRGAGQYAQPN